MRWTPFKVGVLIGFGAALAQAFFKVIPPPAYGVCIACHVRDLVNWILFKVFPWFYGGKFVGAPVSLSFPMLTIVGVIIGASLAARLNGEFQIKTMRAWWHSPVFSFLWGVLVCIGALMMGGCPIRTTLKSAYMDITSMIGLMFIFVGVCGGSFIIKRLIKF